MTTPTSTSTISSADLKSSLQIVEVKPGTKFSLATLRSFLPDVETTLFFGKVYDLDYRQLSTLIYTLFKTDLTDALFGEAHTHSSDLQGYLVGSAEHQEHCSVWDEDGDEDPDAECDCTPDWVGGIITGTQAGDVVTSPDVPKGEILPEVWKSIEIDVAQSIKDVAAKLESTVGHMPGKQGAMVFKTMMAMNAKRPTLGVGTMGIKHARQQQNLLILDVSGSMSAQLVARIVDDVVALAYTANAHLAIVSDNAFHWDPGAYDTTSVLAKAEYWGTHYEELADLLKQDWGTVITVADYDSSPDAKRYLKDNCHGHIDLVLDVSLVRRPTYLAECVGQFADEVRPILIANVNDPRYLPVD